MLLWLLIFCFSVFPEITARSIGTLQYVSHQIDNSMVTKPVEDLVTGSIHIQKVCLKYILGYCHSSPPLMWPLPPNVPLHLSGHISDNWDSKILVNCPPQERPAFYKATFSMQKGFCDLIKGRLLHLSSLSVIFLYILIDWEMNARTDVTNLPVKPLGEMYQNLNTWDGYQGQSSCQWC